MNEKRFKQLTDELISCYGDIIINDVKKYKKSVNILKNEKLRINIGRIFLSLLSGIPQNKRIDYVSHLIAILDDSEKVTSMLFKKEINKMIRKGINKKDATSIFLLYHIATMRDDYDTSKK